MSENKHTKRILLTQGQFAIVDTKNYEWLSKWKWYARWDKTIQNFYAVRNEKDQRTKKRYTISMAREILGLKYGDKREADHITHKTLDNRECNLRICTGSQNCGNQRARKTMSNYKGVSWDREKRKWRVIIMKNYERMHLGYFESEIEAAKAYDKAAKKHFGKFAQTNF